MSTASGLLRGTRALLAAAKSSAASAPKPTIPKEVAAAAAVTAKSPKKKRTASPNSGIMKPKPISLALQGFLGEPEISRTGAVKKIWEHINLNNLKNPANKKEIICDDKLQKLFGKETVGFLEIGKLLSPHFEKTA